MIRAILSEMEMRSNEFKNEIVKTIYFGGGTPSVLSTDEINRIIQTAYANYSIAENAEITLEANPDDLSENKIKELSQSKINRLSIGIQSFFEEDLKLMNRAHTANQAEECLSIATKYFENISVDLIYGIPKMSNQRWKQNIQKTLRYNIPHISSYALTVEPKTALEKFIAKGIIDTPKDEVAEQHFKILIEELEQVGFIHYELSNFGKQGFFSENNSAYWQGKKYMGIGPSAHSFNGIERGWNIANNPKYIKKIQSGQLAMEVEELSITDKYNEYVMTGLRTIWGVSLEKIEKDFGNYYAEYLKMQSQKYILEDLLYLENNILRTTLKGKFLSDGIASDLFKLNLS